MFNRAKEVKRRRSFAIIAHPDAGKTTLTEKLLLFGGAIHLAGEVKAKKNRIQSRSDWMKIERERGISVVTSVMTFEYNDIIFNLLDTPGHEDFADDTYRTLTAVDGAIMVLDGAKGIEPRTLKLFEVCRLRNIPIITFINKMDREAQDPFILLDEIENKLALTTVPMTWPVGIGKELVATYHLHENKLRLNKDANEEINIDNVSDIRLLNLLPESQRDTWVESVSFVKEACDAFCLKSFKEGHLTPVYFGSALKNLGVLDLIEAISEYGESPRSQSTNIRTVDPVEDKMSGFIFKIQANMDPQHRDRIAFMRVCSGELKRGMKVNLVRTSKPITLSAPQFFFARTRQTLDVAVAGDIVGIPNHGTLRIGDTLTEGEKLLFKGVPNFAPEILRRINLSDKMKAKKLKEALHQLAQEGVVQIFVPDDGSAPIVGVIGALQLDVLLQRLELEYNICANVEMSRYQICRWIKASTDKVLADFIDSHRMDIAYDLDGDPVFLAANLFSLNYELERWENIQVTDVKDYQVVIA
ncbi:peptide chain release factor 3 [Bartonella sp. DGB1]|uniref:peptide chain release factor 3 n=1 Tax=Bartonella sp. DGB1 TaxID=3239807 RepID=UPI0035256379